MTANQRLIKRTKDINAEYMFSELPTEEAYALWHKQAIDSAELYKKELDIEFNSRKVN